MLEIAEHYILCCIHIDQNILILFFLFFSSLLFSISARCSSLLSPHPLFCSLPPTKPLPSANHSISYFLSLDLHLKGRTSKLHPLSAISCPAPMWVCVCVFRSVLGKWACVCVCGSGLVLVVGFLFFIFCLLWTAGSGGGGGGGSGACG